MSDVIPKIIDFSKAIFQQENGGSAIMSQVMNLYKDILFDRRCNKSLLIYSRFVEMTI